jgi:hypothetical protein
MIKDPLMASAAASMDDEMGRRLATGAGAIALAGLAVETEFG